MSFIRKDEDHGSCKLKYFGIFVLLYSIVITTYNYVNTNAYSNSIFQQASQVVIDVERTTKELSPSKVTETSNGKNKKKQTPYKVLFVFFVGDDETKNQITEANIQVLRGKEKLKKKYQFDCLILSDSSYGKRFEWLKRMEAMQPPTCRVVYLFSYSTTWKIQYLDPYWLRRAGYDYVTITLDHVYLTPPPKGTFELEKYFDVITHHNLSVASPRIANSRLDFSSNVHKEENVAGRTTRMVEFASISIRIDAYECWYQLNDSQYPSGWGVHLWFYDYCVRLKKLKNPRMGILDFQFISLLEEKLLPNRIEAKTKQTWMNAQIENWRKHRNVSLLLQWNEAPQPPHEEIILFPTEGVV